MERRQAKPTENKQLEVEKLKHGLCGCHQCRMWRVYYVWSTCEEGRAVMLVEPSPTEEKS